MNLVAAVGIARVFRRMRRGEFDEAELERHLHNRGFLARLLGRVTRRVSKPWHLYPVGLLMGLGFDTATAGGPAGARRRHRPPSRCPGTRSSSCRSSSPPG